MSGAWLEDAARLERDGRPFVLATVVARQPPQSVRPGAKAIVFPDGVVMGWVGGGCVRPTVIREALAALEDGRPRLVRISSEAEPDGRAGVRVYAMTCQGEGAVDVYLEPVLPKPELLVLGRTPVAEALARLAGPLEFRVRVADPRAEPERFPGVEVLGAVDAAVREASERSYVVVATQGEGDEEALEAAVRSAAPYVGLVASRKKGGVLRAYLTDRGLPGERIDRIRCPAGLDFGAVTPAEIALSILAEIVQVMRTARMVLPVTPSPAPQEDVVVADPVCGMAVEVRSARHTQDHDGRTYYFCCPNCKARFAREPGRYLAAAAGG